ncbi:MAG: UTP--glucose-1-phosphate uridylyltransferase [Deltaproteobacteria bacterium]|nr:MAG: UTP--glucose-1-phosphate uridylyltransferase [Deltaproteobacteria bacterium]
MQNAGLPSLVIDTFSYYYDQVVTGETGLVYDRDIKPVESGDIEDFNHLKKYGAAGKRAFNHAVRIVLNGGLGTSMGLTGPKSLLKVKHGKSFLEIILARAQKYDVPLVLMNSFNTHKATEAALRALNPSRPPLLFLQHKFPKILRDTLAPAYWPQDRAMEWNPPGHGDIYTALYTSGVLQALLNMGIRYAFISNSDNLGAAMDAALLGYFSENDYPFMMEVAEKTPADVKGGHLAKLPNGRLLLREAAQCPQNELGAFQDIQRYRFFNTNNIWLNLRSLQDLIEKEKTVHLTMILNPKTLDPRDDGSPKVYQIESAMGAAISLFEGATAVKVPRSRFFPVKKCNDLLTVRSDCFVLTDDEQLIINPARIKNNRAELINIKLDPKYYGKIDWFDERFKQGVPSLVDCDSLTIEGDVFFEKNVTIKGSVILKNTNKTSAVIKEGSVIADSVSF